MNATQLREALTSTGLSEQQVEAAIGALRAKTGIDVVVNPADERKYGDVSVIKVQSNGFRKPVMGLWKNQIEDFIGKLQEAYAALDTAE